MFPAGVGFDLAWLKGVSVGQQTTSGRTKDGVYVRERHLPAVGRSAILALLGVLLQASLVSLHMLWKREAMPCLGFGMQPIPRKVIALRNKSKDGRAIRRKSSTFRFQPARNCHTDGGICYR